MCRDNEGLPWLFALIPICVSLPFALFICWRFVCRRRKSNGELSAKPELSSKLNRASFIVASALSSPQNFQLARVLQDLSAIGFQDNLVNSSSNHSYFTRGEEADSMIGFLNRAPLPPPPPVPPNTMTINRSEKHSQMSHSKRGRIPSPPFSRKDPESQRGLSLPLRISSSRKNPHSTSLHPQEVKNFSLPKQSIKRLHHHPWNKDPWTETKERQTHSFANQSTDVVARQTSRHKIAGRIRRLSQPRGKFQLEDAVRQHPRLNPRFGAQKQQTGILVERDENLTVSYRQQSDGHCQGASSKLMNLSDCQLPSPPGASPRQAIALLSCKSFPHSRKSNDNYDLYDDVNREEFQTLNHSQHMPSFSLSPPQDEGNNGLNAASSLVPRTPIKDNSLLQNQIRQRSRSRESESSNSRSKVVYTASSKIFSSETLRVPGDYDQVDQCNPIYFEL